VALLEWAVAAAAGRALTRLTFRTARLAVANGLVQSPGSPVLLLRNLLIVVVKFAFAVALARLPDWHGDLVLAGAGVIAGYVAGYFVGMAQFIRIVESLAGC
jgi:hypothetical protein